jgi:uncharacterized protein YdeI (YjbR/CyaY-like superfamily)
MAKVTVDFPIVEFRTRADLRSWLVDQHCTSDGVWVRLFKKSSAIPSITFDQLLDEGLCFGWSESTRRSYNENSYLQKFAPRKKRGTTYERNRKRIEVLIDAGMMTRSGLDVLYENNVIRNIKKYSS